MPDILVKYFSKIKKAVGLEIILSQHNDWELNLAEVRIEKGIIRTIQKNTGIKGIDNAVGHIPKNVPVIISICGKGILFKKTNQTGSPIHLQDVFPGIAPADFYYQAIDIGDQKYVAILRRNILNDVLSELRRLDVHVYNVFLGPFAICHILPLMKYLTEVQTSCYDLIIGQEKIQQINGASISTPQTCLIGDEHVMKGEILAYASAISPFLSAPVEESPASPVPGLKDEWRQKAFYKTAGTALLAFFFLVLLANTFFYFEASKNNDELKAKARQINSLVVQLEQLKKEVESRKRFIESIGWTKSPRPAFYADQLALSTPSQVNWTELVLFPTDEARLKKDRKKYYIKDKIQLSGKCKDPVLLNNWLKSLEKETWVKAIENQEYHYDYSENTGLFHFSIILR
jgi:hypothetical protein